ncbi:MAG TPA: cupin domain-containing protein [Chloroflexia bacterium]|nr:cupin domain-containing protein [Chloroflexia bacterium]
MIRTGDMLENPVTGERLLFRKTSSDTGGEATIFETFLKPNGFVAAAHVHPFQEERFEILQGRVGFRHGRATIVAGPGGRLVVPAGTPHRFWNAGEEEAHFLCEVRPALQFEQLIETMFALAADGKTNDKGLPNLLQLAVIADATFDTVRLPFPPAWVQRLGLSVLAPIGSLLGYRQVYALAAQPARGNAAAYAKVPVRWDDAA